MSSPDAERIFLGVTLTASLMQGLVGIAKFGYVGQDFDYHYNLLISFPQGFSYKYTNPPAIYALGQAVGTFISQTWILELTAFVLIIFNTLSLWLWYFILKRIIVSREIRYAAMLVATFVPFRVIHSVVYAADALTVPIFVLVVWYAIKLFEKPGTGVRTWAKMGWLMTLGVVSKYTFVGLLPMLALIALHEVLYAETGRSRFIVAVTVVGCLLVPSWVFLVQMDLSRKLGGITMAGQWLAPSQPPEMTVGDLVGLKPRDLELLRAPQYFKDELYQPHKYSYLGLLHLAAFTDVLNYFQQDPDIARHAFDHKQQIIGLTRSRRVMFWSRAAVVASLPFSLASLVGTALIGAASLYRLLLNRGPVALPLAIVAVLGVGFYAPIILHITKMAWAYRAGYWLPRLVMPALLTFLAIGFVLLDRILTARPISRSPILSKVCLAYTAAVCAVYVRIT